MQTTTKVPLPHPAARTPAHFDRNAGQGPPLVLPAILVPTSFFQQASRRFQQDELPDTGHLAKQATNLHVKIPAARHFPTSTTFWMPDFQPLKRQMFENPAHAASVQGLKVGPRQSEYQRVVPARDKSTVGRLPPVVGRVFVENLPAFLVQLRVLTYFCGAFNGFTQNSQPLIG